MKTDKFSNQEISELLRGIAGALQIKKENRFKIIAYERAADTIEHLGRELKDIWQEGKLDTVPTLGTSIRASMDEYFKTGRIKHFETLLKDIPSPVFELMKVPSIGPQKAFKLAQTLKLKDPKTVVKDLQHAARLNEIANIPTFGKKSQDAIVESLAIYQRNKTKERRMPLPIAYSVAQRVMEYLKKHSKVKRIDALGSLRRMVSTIGDVDIAVSIEGSNVKDIIEYFLKYPDKLKVEGAGEHKASIIVSPNVRVDLLVQEEKTYGSALQYFTGGKSHNIKLREYAQKKGLSLNEYGIKNVKTGKVTPFTSEEDFYKHLGMTYIPPEIREGTTEVELALKNRMPDLVELRDIKGDLHIHSSYDLKPSHDFGTDTYKELLQEAEKYKYEYLGFADHNPKTGGLSKQEIVEIMRKRQDFIKKTCADSKVKYFISLETDILPDGSLALPDEAIQYVDFLIISVHSSFQQDMEQMTKRFLKAMSYPKVKIIGHPTGRLLGRREGYELKWQVIFEEAKKKNIALEINAWPERLDLPDSLVREAHQYGVKFMIDTDSHAKDQMENMRYGVSVARRGWLTKHDIINTYSYNEFKTWIMQ